MGLEPATFQLQASTLTSRPLVSHFLYSNFTEFLYKIINNCACVSMFAKIGSGKAKLLMKCSLFRNVFTASQQIHNQFCWLHLQNGYNNTCIIIMWPTFQKGTLSCKIILMKCLPWFARQILHFCTGSQWNSVSKKASVVLVNYNHNQNPF